MEQLELYIFYTIPHTPSGCEVLCALKLGTSPKHYCWVA
jgi:hypothetical protein